MQEASGKDIMDKVNDFKEIVNGFSELLATENKALTDFDLDVVGSLFDRKSKSVAAYRSLVAYFIKNQTDLNALDEKIRAELKECSLKLDALLQENDRLLKTRMETSKTVMDSIINIAKITNNANATSYGAQGKYSPLDNNKNAIAVNRTL